MTVLAQGYKKAWQDHRVPNVEMYKINWVWQMKECGFLMTSFMQFQAKNFLRKRPHTIIRLNCNVSSNIPHLKKKSQWIKIVKQRLLIIYNRIWKLTYKATKMHLLIIFKRIWRLDTTYEIPAVSFSNSCYQYDNIQGPLKLQTSEVFLLFQEAKIIKIIVHTSQWS